MVTGAGGQLGAELRRLLEGREAALATHADLDVCDQQAVLQAVGAFKPAAVIHAAAFTDVDRCESEAERAHLINTIGAWNVALACRRAGAAMVYVSTNYVFDGSKPGPYVEYDSPGPISVYGASKLGGERAAAQVLADLYVVRSAWIYSPWKRNFVSSLLEAAKTRPKLRYVNDQLGNPTRASDLAAAILDLIPSGAFGVYHLACEGSTSWYGWARATLEAARVTGVEIEAIPASEYSRPAAVPPNGALANTAGRSLGVVLPHWRAALTEFVSSQI